MKVARFYLLATSHCDNGRQYSWHHKRRDAVKERNRFIDQEGDMVESTRIEKIEIPLNTDAIVAWLNRHFTSDNG